MKAKEQLIKRIEEILACLTEDQLEAVYWLVRRMERQKQEKGWPLGVSLIFFVTFFFQLNPPVKQVFADFC